MPTLRGASRNHPRPQPPTPPPTLAGQTQLEKSREVVGRLADEKRHLEAALQTADETAKRNLSRLTASVAEETKACLAAAQRLMEEEREREVEEVKRGKTEALRLLEVSADKSKRKQKFKVFKFYFSTFYFSNFFFITML